MSSKFIRAEDGSIHIIFNSQEAHVLINLTEQILELLGDGGVNADIDADPFFQMMGLGSMKEMGAMMDLDSFMDSGGSEQPPEDPVLRRLLPNAYKDEKSASEFRRYTEHGLREKKRAHALTVYEALIPQDEGWNADQPIDRGSLEINFNESDAMAWLGALNDLRLALAVRLGISKEFTEGGTADGSGSDRSGSDGEMESEFDSDIKSGFEGVSGIDATSQVNESNERFAGASEKNKSDAEAGDIHKKYELMTESDPMKAVYAVYSWLGWLQQSLLELLMSSGDEHQAT